MDNNLSHTEEPAATCYTGEYLDLLLHGPHSSSVIDIELKKIDAHFAQEESIMIRLVASLGLTFCLLAIIAFCI